MKLLFGLIFTLSLSMSASARDFTTVTPNASKEAKALLSYLYTISGKQILTGQHNAPLNGSNRLMGLHKQVGEYPAIFGQDFGFSEPGSWDGINFRQNIVDEAIRRHDQGFIITLMWHAVAPIHDEPQTFENSVQAKLTDQQWQELLTPGTHLNERWKSQVDVIAWHLKQLKYAKVPVLWRPYHEMNGFWFWWGKRQGPEGYAKLWRMLFDRLVNFHQLDNLIWVWNANEVKENVPDYKLFYPGHDVVDVLATDVYSGQYNKNNYDQMVALAEGRPIGLGEIGKLPTTDMLNQQPQWAWFMSWRDPDNFFWNDNDSLKQLFNYKKSTGLHELPWVNAPKAVRLHQPILK
ncbi:glycoside hydrolase family 26 protein [Marinagarivorans algicola]|uniref:glycoside hydrolase family 26 protein n=1 Tax=Marinagarivorans algicola TaxID=1513270 RepID=UPI000B2EA98B|nr:glycosyl hydrolase [Marinagarivorans algicola]